MPKKPRAINPVIDAVNKLLTRSNLSECVVQWAQITFCTNIFCCINRQHTQFIFSCWSIEQFEKASNWLSHTDAWLSRPINYQCTHVKATWLLDSPTVILLFVKILHPLLHPLHDDRMTKSRACGLKSLSHH